MCPSSRHAGGGERRCGVVEDGDRAATLGVPSLVWREGQERRVRFLLADVVFRSATVLDAGCGVGLYMQRFRDLGAHVVGVDIDAARVAEAKARDLAVAVASAEALPFGGDAFDVVFSHEVLEHVGDDAAAIREGCRVLGPGGQLVVYCPNRWYPFETHGCYWRGSYHFGNIPFINYLPRSLRDRLCPHVRAYTRRGVRRLFRGLNGSIVRHQIIFAGFDSMISRWPRLGVALRFVCHALERTPLSVLGLSHLVVFEKGG